MLYFFMVAHKAACKTLSKEQVQPVSVSRPRSVPTVDSNRPTVLLSSFLEPFSCTSWCCCSLPCELSQILQVRIFSFSVFLLLSHRSRISAVSSCCFFLLTMFAKDLTGCFSHCCVEGGDHRIYVCIFVAHDGERCKPPAYHSLEAFQNVWIFQLFEVKLESCVFLLSGFCLLVFANTRSLKVANSRSLSPLSFVSSLPKGPQMPCKFPQASLPTFAFQSPCTTRMSFFGVWSMTFCSWS